MSSRPPAPRPRAPRLSLAESERLRARERAAASFFELVTRLDDEAAVLDALADHVIEIVRGTASVYTLSPDGERLELTALSATDATRGEAFRATAARFPIRPGEGPGGRAMRGESTFTPSLTPEGRADVLDSLFPGERAVVEHLAPFALMTVPIHVGGRPIGFLAASRMDDDPEPFEEADFDYLRTLAARATLALDAVAAHRQLREDAERQRVVAEFVQAAGEAGDERDLLETLARHVSEVADASLAIYLIAEGGRELEAVALQSNDDVAERFREMYGRRPWGASEGFLGQAVQTGRDVFRSYLGREERQAYLEALPADRAQEMGERDLRAIVVVPIARAGQPTAVLSLARYGADARPLTEGDRRFAIDLAGRASVAVTRLAEAQDRERDVERRRLLAEFMEAALQARGERDVFEQLAERTAAAVGAACIVYRLRPAGDEMDVLALAGYADASTQALASMFTKQRWRAGEGVSGAAFATGRTKTAYFATPAEREVYLAGLSEEHREVIGALGPRAALGVPLIASGERIGALSLTRYGEGAAPFSDADVAFVADIADRAAVALGRQALIAAQARTSRILGAVFNAAPLATYLTDHERRVLLWNPAAEHLFGWTAEEAIGGRAPSIPLERSDEASSLGDRIAAGEVIPGVPAIRRRKDGTDVEVEVYGAAVDDETGQPGILAIYADVTERNRLQREVARTSETLRAILDASPLAIVATDLGRRVTYWNHAAEELYGWSTEEALGELPYQLMPDEPDPFAPDIPRVLAGETVVHDDVHRRTKSGEVMRIRMSAAPIHGPGGRVVGMIGIHEDLSELKRLQEDLSRTWRTLAAILAASPLPVIAVDDERRVTFWSAAAERLYGWRTVEVIGRPAPFTNGDVEAHTSLLARVLAGETVEAEVRRTAKDGRVLDVHLHASPLRDEEGRIRGALEVHDDVTAQRRLEAELLQAQKMETVGRLAGGIAHDFNNILAAILGNAELALDDARDPDQRESLETIKTSAERAAGLTRQLLAFSRQQRLQPTVVSPAEIVLGMESMLRRLIGERVELVTAVDRDPGSVLVDRTQLEQVILNLAVNARDAMPDGGRLAIRVVRELVREDQVAPDGEYVAVSVADTGLGLDEETAAHIFEPFFTTKGVGQGTGLGLATVYGIVRQSGGFITVRSRPGGGTTFRILLPRAASPAPVRPPEPTGDVQRRGRLLLVEDDDNVRALAGSLLGRAGLEVVPARDPGEALRRAESDGPFDLLLTDVVMPGISGVELAGRLREQQPSLAVIFMSGYAEDHVRSGEASVFLAKPFTSQALLHAVDAAFAARRRASR